VPAVFCAGGASAAIPGTGDWTTLKIPANEAAVRIRCIFIIGFSREELLLSLIVLVLVLVLEVQRSTGLVLVRLFRLAGVFAVSPTIQD
jgi:hypothetical protein